MYRLYIGLWQENVQLTIYSSHNGQLLVSSSQFSPLICKGVDSLMLDCGLLTEGEEVVTPSFYRLMLLNGMPWPAVTLGMGGSQRFLDMTCPTLFGLYFASSSLLLWALPGRQANTNFGWGEGGVGYGISKHWAEGLQPVAILLFSHLQTDDILSLFSKILNLKS
jgi:hypothetical protein